MIKTTTIPEAWEVAYKIADTGEYIGQRKAITAAFVTSGAAWRS